MAIDPITPEQAPIAVRGYFERGQPGPLTGTLAHVPELLEVAMPFIGKALSALGVHARSKEIVILRASALQGCSYCIQTHSVVALDSGLDVNQVRALRGEVAMADGFVAPADLALLAWTEAIAAGPGPVDSALLEQLGAHFEPHQVVELTLAAGATLMLNRYCTALALPTAAAHLQRLAAEGLL